MHLTNQMHYKSKYDWRLIVIVYTFSLFLFLHLKHQMLSFLPTWSGNNIVSTFDRNVSICKNIGYFSGKYSCIVFVSITKHIKWGYHCITWIIFSISFTFYTLYIYRTFTAFTIWAIRLNSIHVILNRLMQNSNINKMQWKIEIRLIYIR